MKAQLTEAVARRQMHNIRHVGKAPIWKYPTQYEVLYRQFIISVVNELREKTLALIEKLTSVIAQRDTETRTDAWPDSLAALLDALRIGFDQATHDNKIQTQLFNIGQRTADWNDEQWQNTLLQVLGVDVYRREQFLGSHIKSFVQEGSSLIKKLTENTYHDVATVLTRGIRSGDRVETIRKSLLTETDLGPGVFRKVETRARLIARDQVGKLNGELTRTRQEAIGVKQYKWHTALDERVRGNPAGLYPNADPSHYDREGEIFDWATAPEGGHPGEAIQCRCWAEAIFPEEVDETTEEEPTEEEDPAIALGLSPGTSPTEAEMIMQESTIPEAVDKGILPMEKTISSESTELPLSEEAYKDMLAAIAHDPTKTMADLDKFHEAYEAAKLAQDIAPLAEGETIKSGGGSVIMSPTLEEIAKERELKNYMDYSSYGRGQDIYRSPRYQLLLKETEAWRAGLSEQEKTAVIDFTNSSWLVNRLTSGRSVSGYSVADVNRAEQTIKALQSALERSSLPEDVIVYRGIGIDFLTVAPEKTVGKIFEQTVFQSTSLVQSISKGFAESSIDKKKMLLKIRVPAGTKGIAYVDPISTLKGEREATMARHKRILITKVTKTKAEFQQEGQWWIAEGVLTK